jgi:hypothetical protein
MTEPVPRIIAGDTIGPVDATVVPRYAGEATFARLPRLDEVTQADVAAETAATTEEGHPGGQAPRDGE